VLDKQQIKGTLSNLMKLEKGSDGKPLPLNSLRRDIDLVKPPQGESLMSPKASS
jgi:hypothetical protein